MVPEVFEDLLRSCGVFDGERGAELLAASKEVARQFNQTLSDLAGERVRGMGQNRRIARLRAAAQMTIAAWDMAGAEEKYEEMMVPRFEELGGVDHLRRVLKETEGEGA